MRDRKLGFSGWWGLLTLLVLIGCSGGSKSVTKDGVEQGDVTAPEDAAGTGDVGAGELPDFTAPDVLSDAKEIFQECQPGEGCFLDPCNDNGDCLSGLCVEHMGEKVCTQFCVEECPQGWSCQQISLGGSDLLFACVSKAPVLCRPCVDDLDCLSAGGNQDGCVDYGPDGNFCGAGCGADQACPDGYACQEVESVLGVLSSQCVPQDGLCACTETAMLEGADTICQVTNEFGTCNGIRFCAKDGLTDCDAAIPAQESCNGQDDDCDGQVDEVDCDDGNPCTQDSCDSEEGCQHAPLDGLQCDDGSACTENDECAAGLCVGQAIDCDDGNVCTDDWCDPGDGCVHGNSNEECDDGDPCTVGDQCKQGVCAGTGVPCDCVTNSDCADLEDGNLCNGTLYCDTSKVPFQCRVVEESIVVCPDPEGLDAACQKAVCEPGSGACKVVAAKEGATCTDGDTCTLGDLCVEGACVGQLPLNCDDGNPCTIDSCDPLSGCKHAAQEGACDDGNACTVNDACAAGKCKGTATLDCDDDNVCTKDTCDPLSGCLHLANTAPCDDGDACTVGDLCADKACVPGPAADCDDGNVCTDDSCDPATGCQHAANTAACDDNNSCTKGDHCVAGKCVGEAVVQCDDGNPCTDDLCSVNLGCSHVVNTAPCDDGNACTVGDTCGEGACQPGTAPLDCDDDNVCTDDSCDPESGCQHAANTAPCDDGNFCTASDLCEGGKCTSKEPVDCDDDNVCTTDLCSPLTGCVHIKNGLPCTDGNACTVGDLCVDGACVGQLPLPCNDGNPCTDDSCDPDSGCQFEANSLPCDDGNVCSVDDTCFQGWCKGTGTLECDDGNVCTTDYCKPASGCVNVANNVGVLCSGDACQSGTGKLK